ncbi:hypothetical protein HK102_006621, partial [Quaeritorhiza haematococci]
MAHLSQHTYGTITVTNLVSFMNDYIAETDPYYRMIEEAVDKANATFRISDSNAAGLTVRAANTASCVASLIPTICKLVEK